MTGGSDFRVYGPHPATPGEILEARHHSVIQQTQPADLRGARHGTRPWGQGSECKGYSLASRSASSVRVHRQVRGGGTGRSIGHLEAPGPGQGEWKAGAGKASLSLSSLSYVNSSY